MITVITEIQKELAKRDLKGRAELVREVIDTFYKHEKFNCPGGEGLDGKDGEPRRRIGEMRDLAENYYSDVLQGNIQ